MAQERLCKAGDEELRAALREGRALYWAVGVFSFVVNLLMLTGPLYMLNVYDRVLGSRSTETLLALSVLAAFLFMMMGLLDHVRGRVMGRVGARFQTRLDARVFCASQRAAMLGLDQQHADGAGSRRTPMQAAPEGLGPGLNRGAGMAANGPQDLESVQRLITSPVFMALFDLPWTPIFFLGIFVFHPWLGMLALLGGASLVLIAVVNQIVTRHPHRRAIAAGHRADLLGHAARQEAEMVQALGMRGAALARWQAAREAALVAAIRTTDAGGSFAATTRAFRLFLQSAMLGLGAYLVLRGELTAGAMIAGSILLGRGLAPLELMVGQWPLFHRAREGWLNLTVLLGQTTPDPGRMALPVPRAFVEAVQVTVVPPGATLAALRMISFQVQPGQAVGVIGTSGAGKTTLARALTGVWTPAAGKIRLDGAALDQFEPDVLGQHVGYLPQRVVLFDGTIRENIARMSLAPDDAAVVRAATQAAAHEMILRLVDGYDTRVHTLGCQLSGGQVQRIGLARALYGDPVVLVLDEPNSNLDHEGTSALNAAIRTMKARQRCVFIMAHRPAAIQECDLLLVLENGIRKAFGPKEEVLRAMVQNHREIHAASRAGGMT